MTANGHLWFSLVDALKPSAPLFYATIGAKVALLEQIRVYSSRSSTTAVHPVSGATVRISWAGSVLVLQVDNACAYLIVRLPTMSQTLQIFPEIPTYYL